MSTNLHGEVSIPAFAVNSSSHCHSCKRQRDEVAHLLVCAGCHQARYCDKACQKAHWLCHKFKCKGYRLKSADILVNVCLQQEFPEDADVLEDFGIKKFFNPVDRQSLFGLYRDMVLSKKISAYLLDKWLGRDCLREGIIFCYTGQRVSKLFQWQTEGSLREHILESYSSTDKNWDPRFGDCFVWFLRSLATFSLEEPNWTLGEKVDSWRATKLPLLLDTKDRDIPFSEIQPVSKRGVVNF